MFRAVSSRNVNWRNIIKKNCYIILANVIVFVSFAAKSTLRKRTFSLCHTHTPAMTTFAVTNQANSDGKFGLFLRAWSATVVKQIRVINSVCFYTTGASCPAGSQVKRLRPYHDRWTPLYLRVSSTLPLTGFGRQKGVSLVLRKALLCRNHNKSSWKAARTVLSQLSFLSDLFFLKVY